MRVISDRSCRAGNGAKCSETILKPQPRYRAKDMGGRHEAGQNEAVFSQTGKTSQVASRTVERFANVPAPEPTSTCSCKGARGPSEQPTKLLSFTFVLGRLWRSRDIMRSLVSTWLAAISDSGLLVPAVALGADPVFPGRTWETADPQARGWSVDRLQDARKHFRKIGSTAVLIVHDGRVIAAWGNTRSGSKSILCARAFSARSMVSRWSGVRSILSSTLQDLKIDDKPPRSPPREKVSNSAISSCALRRPVAAARRRRRVSGSCVQSGSHAPGTFWYYNNWDFNALGTILQNVTQEDTFCGD